MSEIYFIRHGQASFGSKNYDRLSEKGVLQAKILGRHIAFLGVRFDAICFGEMERQERTAKEMTNAYREQGIFVPKPVVDASFNEYDSALVWDFQTKMMLKDDPGLLDELEQDQTNKKAIEISWQVMSASITRIKYNSRNISLAGFNEITHLELTGDKTLLT